jgi:hypothetical protein
LTLPATDVRDVVWISTARRQPRLGEYHRDHRGPRRPVDERTPGGDSRQAGRAAHEQERTDRRRREPADVQSKLESHRISFEWARRSLPAIE